MDGETKHDRRQWEENRKKANRQFHFFYFMLTFLSFFLCLCGDDDKMLCCNRRCFDVVDEAPLSSSATISHRMNLNKHLIRNMREKYALHSQLNSICYRSLHSFWISAELQKNEGIKEALRHNVNVEFSQSFYYFYYSRVILVLFTALNCDIMCSVAVCEMKIIQRAYHKKKLSSGFFYFSPFILLLHQIEMWNNFMGYANYTCLTAQLVLSLKKKKTCLRVAR